MAAASEQASTNLRRVSHAAGQMKHTLNEAAQNCEKVREVSDNAVVKVKKASEWVIHLGRSARDIVCNQTGNQKIDLDYYRLQL